MSLFKAKPFTCLNCGNKFFVYESALRERRELAKDKTIDEIISLFAGWNPNETCVWGKDTEIFETLDSARDAVRKILGLRGVGK